MKPYYIVFISGDGMMTVHTTKASAILERELLKACGHTHINIKKKRRQSLISDYYNSYNTSSFL